MTGRGMMDTGKGAAGISRKRSGWAGRPLTLAAGLGLACVSMGGSILWAQTATDGLSMGIPETQAAPPVAPVPAGFQIATIKVQGNDHVDTATIISYLALPKGQTVTEAQLNDAYQRVFASGLFARVELVPQKSTLLVKVVENPMLSHVDFQGNARIKDADLAKVVKSKPRQIYSPAQAEADAAIMTDFYQSQGRLAAKITPRIIRRANNQVDLVFEITEGGVAEIQRLSFVGNKAFSDYRLRQVLSSKQAGILHNFIQRDMYSADRVELDKKLLSDFYLSRGYLDFKILDASATYARGRDGTFLTFTIDEGQPFKIGKVDTVSEVSGVDAAEFAKLERVGPGMTYSPNLIQNNVEALESLALKKGLNFITVEPRLKRNDRDGTVDVTFALVKGQRIFVERIDIEGNTTTLDSVIRREFRTVEGDPMNAREVAQAAERIRALGFFSDVQVTEEPGSAPDQDVVKVNVTEAPTGSLMFGGTYSVASGFGLSIGFSETNFLGRGQGLKVDVQTGTSNVDSQIVFTEPAFLGRNVAFSFAAAYATTKHQSASYDTRDISVAPALTFPVSDFGKLRLGYKIARETLSNVDPGSSLVIIDEAGSRVDSQVGYSYTWDNRKSGLHPNGGVSLQFGQDFSGLGGDVKYVNTSAMALAETMVMHETVTLRASIEGGAIASYGGYDTRVTDRYFGNKIRGFEPMGIGPRDLLATNTDALGGNYFAVAHLESEFPLGLPEEYGITGGAFVDVGSVWGLNSAEKAKLDPTSVATTSAHLRSVAGLTVFWKTPIGPLRFDFTKALKKESYDKEQSFNFSISTKF